MVSARVIFPEKCRYCLVSLRIVGLSSKLINRAVPDQIDERALNLPKPGKNLNKWEMQENANLAIGAAQSLGCKIVNIHAGMCELFS